MSASSSRQEAPLIHVSQARSSSGSLGDDKDTDSDGGIDNPIFTFENVDFGFRASGPAAELVNVALPTPCSTQTTPEEQKTVVAEKEVKQENGAATKIANGAPSADLRGNTQMHTLAIDHRSSALTPLSPGGRSNLSMWSELNRLARRSSIDSQDSQNSEKTISGLSSRMSERIRDLVRRFSSRTEFFREKTVQPPTPSSDNSDARSAISAVSAIEEQREQRGRRLNSFIPMSSRASSVHEVKDERDFRLGCCRVKLPSFLRPSRCFSTLDPQGRLYQFWLFLVTMAFMYNAAAIPLRAAFTKAPYYQHPEYAYNVCTIVTTTAQSTIVNNLTTTLNQGTTSPMTTTTTSSLNQTNITTSTVAPTTTEPVTTQALGNITPEVVCQEVNPVRYKEGVENDNNRYYWWIFDYFSDLLYLLDIVLIKTRVKFVRNGLWEEDPRETKKHYMQKVNFKLDMAALIPFDLLYFIPAVKFNTLVRLPRLLKIQTFWEFYDRIDQASSSAHIVRIVRTMTYMLFLIHIESCGYFAMSALEGLKKNDWVYDGSGNAYIRCMYLATKTATSIGNNPRPTNRDEYIFMTAYWLSGVFVFALLIGQIRDIITSASVAKTHYRKTMDQTLHYMQSLNLPADLQSRVRMWFNYNWEHQKTLNENSLLESLPKKMKADLAINVHFQTLSKVRLFADCDKNLLYDLVLKLKPCLYLPGDYICRKGEVGTEMYIVMMGQVEVVGGPNNSLVFATLHQGSVFGEISLLALVGGNRRTADVRSKGYTQIFILSKMDFEEAMTDYPDAQALLKKRAKKLLKQNAKHEKQSKKMEAEEIIQSRHGTPKLLKTVVQIVAPESDVNEYMRNKIKQGSSHGEIQDDCLSQSSDEILVIEKTETPVVAHENPVAIEKDTQPQIETIQPQPETLQPQTEEPQEQAMSSCDSSVVASILDSPVRKQKTPIFIRKRNLSETDQEDDVAEILQSPTISRPSSGRPKSRIRVNKVGVAPSVEDELDQANTELADVMVHRAKSRPSSGSSVGTIKKVPPGAVTSLSDDEESKDETFC